MASEGANNEQQFPLKRCVRVPGVSRSGYYDRVQHEPSEERLLRPGTACPLRQKTK
ncbi:Transposase [Shigella dysenteriae 1617]|uniref:Transposase n=1 Tax=Shigella dysenteriae 1617 TaxID=754093 RepID=A0A0A6ZNK7_SHIDY|nr:Transposase [Shigella dysenteriae 1617]